MSMIIGITGGIGSGKSAVTTYLRRLGETVICADEVSRQIVEPGQEGAAALRSVFGNSIFHEGGTLDRKKLADDVFGDKKRLELLNDTLHPLIIKSIERQAKALGGRVFIDVALLIQTGMHNMTDIIWLVVADMDTRIKRVMARDGLNEDQVRRRMENQMTDSQMAGYADEIIDNGGSLGDLYRQVDRLLKQLK